MTTIRTHETAACANCGTVYPLQLLDAKPARLAGKLNVSLDVLGDALADNENCDRLECFNCYGPGYTVGV